MSMKPSSGRSGMMAKAAAHQPKGGHSKPAGKKSGSAVGNETSADMKGAFSSRVNK